MKVTARRTMVDWAEAALEIHHTPKHRSWLNMAKSELSILSRQCLQRRIPDLEPLRRDVTAWQQERDQAKVPTI